MKALPIEIRTLKRFLPFKLHDSAAGRKRKVPVDAAGRSIDWRNSDHWLTLDEALAHVHSGLADGVGTIAGYLEETTSTLVIGDSDGASWVEGDMPTSIAAALMRAVPPLYVVISPSGAGLRILWLVPSRLGEERNINGLFELYLTNHFATLTGHKIENALPQGHRTAPHNVTLLKLLADKKTGPAVLKLFDACPNDSLEFIRTALCGDWAEARVDGIDRTGAEYRLARICQEVGLSPQETALIVGASAVHRAKFGNRKDKGERLKSVVSAAFQVGAEPQVAVGKIWSADEFTKADLPEPSWLLPGLLPAQGLTVLAGRPKVGKSWLALDIALSIAGGGKKYLVSGHRGVRPSSTLHSRTTPAASRSASCWLSYLLHRMRLSPRRFLACHKHSRNSTN